MKHSELKGTFKDERGSIEDLLVTGDASVTYITFVKGAVRGNHYHKETVQKDFILSGKFESYVPGKVKLMVAGESLVHPPGRSHAYKALEDGEMVTISFGKRIGKLYEEDTFRLDNPLCK